MKRSVRGLVAPLMILLLVGLLADRAGWPAALLLGGLALAVLLLLRFTLARVRARAGRPLDAIPCGACGALTAPTSHCEACGQPDPF